MLRYVAQDVRTTLELATVCESCGVFRWVARSGRLRTMPLPEGWLAVEEARSSAAARTLPGWTSRGRGRGLRGGWGEGTERENRWAYWNAAQLLGSMVGSFRSEHIRAASERERRVEFPDSPAGFNVYRGINIVGITSVKE